MMSDSIFANLLLDGHIFQIVIYLILRKILKLYILKLNEQGLKYIYIEIEQTFILL